MRQIREKYYLPRAPAKLLVVMLAANTMITIGLCYAFSIGTYNFGNSIVLYVIYTCAGAFITGTVGVALLNRITKEGDEMFWKRKDQEQKTGLKPEASVQEPPEIQESPTEEYLQQEHREAETGRDVSIESQEQEAVQQELSEQEYCETKTEENSSSENQEQNISKNELEGELMLQEKTIATGQIETSRGYIQTPVIPGKEMSKKAQEMAAQMAALLESFKVTDSETWELVADNANVIKEAMIKMEKCLEDAVEAAKVVRIAAEKIFVAVEGR